MDGPRHDLASSGGASKRQILVVDDDCSVRELLARVLMGEGYDVVSAKDGEESLAAASATPIDLVLLDLNLPGMSGWDTFDKLTQKHPLVPVIIITARPNQVFTAMAAGAGALLEKPLDFSNLLRTISSLIFRL
jgi:DNA-binding response OmpR family regulator